MTSFLKHIFAFAFVLSIALVACRKDEISFGSPSRDLRISTDTLFCDTLYHQLRSEMYVVKVYNQEDVNVLIPKIELEGGAKSPYRINVDGKAGYSFSNVPLRAKDSLFVFVDVAPVATTTQAIVEDYINFGFNKKVTLFSVVMDAEYFIQSANNPNIITQNTTWTNAKAKVIFGELNLAEGKNLSIEKGTQVLFAKKAGLKISKNATLNINGDLGSEVVFRSERNSPRYDTLPANWNGIQLEESATANINYAKLFGGNTGIQLSQATLNLNNSWVYSFQDYGVLGINATITARNSVLYDCGQATISAQKGGTIDLTHCTLANYWTLNSLTSAFALQATNEWKNATGTLEYAPLNLSVKNSILYSGRNNAVFLKPTQGQSFNYLFDYSLLKYSNSSGFDFDNNPKVISSIKNLDPKFKNIGLKKTNLRLADDSPAKAKANVQTAQSLPLDIVKQSRQNQPSIGAYQ